MELDKLHYKTAISCVIEGEARGADTLARAWAHSMKIRVEPFPADWKKYGKAAGFMRNQKMLDDGRPDLVVAFWDGKSRGTEMMIELAKRMRIAVKVIEIPVPQMRSSNAST